MKKNKMLAIQLLQEKQNNPMLHTYKFITNQTGYSKAQLIRINNLLLNEKDTESILTHGNKGKKSEKAASS